MHPPCNHEYYRNMQILEYLEAYTEHFGFGKGIIFRTEVLSVLPAPKGGFVVSIKVATQPNLQQSDSACLRCITVLLRTVILTHSILMASGAFRVLGNVHLELKEPMWIGFSYRI